ncbi:MAG: OsmC family protein [Planctomycetes bacterium]|nr:OsmC family protein [Planctomycetota bacterium]
MAATKQVQVQTHIGEGFTITSKIRDHTVYVDQPKGAGGQDTGPNPLEYLLLSLAACISSIGRIVANQQRIALRGIDLTVAGELDTDFLMGKTQQGRAGFLKMTVTAEIDADMSREEKEQFLKEIDRRCPVSDNLANVSVVTIELAQ